MFVAQVFSDDGFLGPFFGDTLDEAWAQVQEVLDKRLEDGEKLVGDRSEGQKGSVFWKIQDVVVVSPGLRQRRREYARRWRGSLSAEDLEGVRERDAEASARHRANLTPEEREERLERQRESQRRYVARKKAAEAEKQIEEKKRAEKAVPRRRKKT